MDVVACGYGSTNSIHSGFNISVLYLMKFGNIFDMHVLLALFHVLAIIIPD